MSNDTVQYGGYHTCQECGKVFYIIDPDIWVYKRYTRFKKNDNSKLSYFCSWHCKRAFDSKYDSSISERKATARSDAWNSSVRCYECRYCVPGHYGFKNCSLYGMPIKPKKGACKRFKPIENKPLDKKSLAAKERRLWEAKQGKEK